MSLLRGIQSAVFHYLSCAPCTGYSQRKRRIKDTKRFKEMRSRWQVEEEEEERYIHPDPSGTNSYWQEEIIMGPGPPPRRGGKRDKDGGRQVVSRTGTHSTSNSAAGCSMERVTPVDSKRASEDTIDDANWNRRRYQREDEELWGLEFLSKEDSTGGSSVGLSVGLSRPSTAYSFAGSYYKARAPPLNELHPPIVSLPSSKASDNRWMLQPPPSAKIMSGKQRATNRSRSASRTSSKVDLNSQRQVFARKANTNGRKNTDLDSEDLGLPSQTDQTRNFAATASPNTNNSTVTFTTTTAVITSQPTPKSRSSRARSRTMTAAPSKRTQPKVIDLKVKSHIPVRQTAAGLMDPFSSVFSSPYHAFEATNQSKRLSAEPVSPKFLNTVWDGSDRRSADRHQEHFQLEKNIPSDRPGAYNISFDSDAPGHFRRWSLDL